jgi:hypothetical protein
MYLINFLYFRTHQDEKEHSHSPDAYCVVSIIIASNTGIPKAAKLFILSSTPPEPHHQSRYKSKRNSYCPDALCVRGRLRHFPESWLLEDETGRVYSQVMQSSSEWLKEGGFFRNSNRIQHQRL